MSKAVVFDIGRVMVHWDLAHLYRDRIANDAERDWFVANVVTPEWHFRHDAGEPLASLVAERKAEFPEHAGMIDAYARHFLDSIPGEVEGMVPILTELFDKGVPVFALTNFADSFWSEFSAAYPWTGLFGDVVVSGRECLVKPDPAIYALAESRFGRTGDDLFFIDDMPANIAASREAGWDAEVFTGAADFRRHLVSRGFLSS